jgi:hypothetical protein
MWCYVGLSMGDLASGFISHWLESRKKAVFFLMVSRCYAACVYLFAGIKSASMLYTVAGFLGFRDRLLGYVRDHRRRAVRYQFAGYGSYYDPNMVRGTVVGMTTLFANFKGPFTVIKAQGIGRGDLFRDRYLLHAD